MAKGDNASADKSGNPKLVGQVNEIKNLTIGYARQEVLGPLKTLGRYLGFGIAGAFAIGIGSVVVLIGVLRVLQTETGSTFRGNWSFAPYLLTTMAGALIMALCIKGIIGPKEKGK